MKIQQAHFLFWTRLMCAQARLLPHLMRTVPRHTWTFSSQSGHGAHHRTVVFTLIKLTGLRPPSVKTSSANSAFVFSSSYTSGDGCRCWHRTSYSAQSYRIKCPRTFLHEHMHAAAWLFIIRISCRWGNSITHPQLFRLHIAVTSTAGLGTQDRHDNANVSPLHHNMLCESDRSVWSCVPAFYTRASRMDALPQMTPCGCII